MLDRGHNHGAAICSTPRAAGSRVSGTAGESELTHLFVPARRPYLLGVRLRHLFIFAAALLCASCAFAQAAPDPAAAGAAAIPSGSSDFWRGLLGLLGAVALIITIWDKGRPKPPLHRQFAPVDHRHSDEYVDWLTYNAHRNQCDGKHETAIAQSINADKAVERRLDDMRMEIKKDFEQVQTALTQGLTAITNRDEERASGLHKRIDPIAARTQSIEDWRREHVMKHVEGRG